MIWFLTKKIISSSVRVVYLIIYWLRTWVILQKPGWQDLVTAVCLFLEHAVTEFFTKGMGSDLVLRLMAIILPVIYFLINGVCPSYAASKSVLSAFVLSWCIG